MERDIVPPISVLIKPASGKCNLNCDYCFYKDITCNREVADYGFMRLDVLETIVKRVLEFADEKATFSFQGGEPTLCGLEFYRRLLDFQTVHNTKSVRICNCIQTNGILLDEEWVKFLHDNAFLVGLSLDGPQEIHDRYRKDTQGAGTYKTVIQKAHLLEKYGVEFNILFVVTKTLSENPGRAYSFFKKNRFDFLQFIPCLDPIPSGRGCHPYSLLPREYTLFLRKFFDRWCDDILSGGDVSVRYFDNLVRMVAGEVPETCSMRGMCSCQFVFEADGACYPCDFYVTGDWRLGNINDMGIMELYQSDANKRFIGSSMAVDKKCLGCKWRGLCRGGCRRDRETHKGDDPSGNYYCRSYSDFLEYAYPKLQEIACFVHSEVYRRA
jgi:uncharacterized protein